MSNFKSPSLKPNSASHNAAPLLSPFAAESFSFPDHITGDAGEDTMRAMLEGMSNIFDADTDSGMCATPMNLKDHKPSKITDDGRIYVGNEANARDETLLSDLGITHILNCKSGHPLPINNIEISQVPLGDKGNSDLEHTKFPAAFEFLDKAFKNKKSKCLIHCQLGQNRSITMAMGYLVHHYKMNLQEAYFQCMDRRAIACINHKYAVKLIAWEKATRGKSSISIDEFVTTRSVLADLANHGSLMMIDNNQLSRRDTDDLISGDSMERAGSYRMSLLKEHASFRIFAEFKKFGLQEQDEEESGSIHDVAPNMAHPDHAGTHYLESSLVLDDNTSEDYPTGMSPRLPDIESKNVDQHVDTEEVSGLQAIPPDRIEKQSSQKRPPNGCCVIS